MFVSQICKYKINSIQSDVKLKINRGYRVCAPPEPQKIARVSCTNNVGLFGLNLVKKGVTLEKTLHPNPNPNPNP